MSAVIGAAGRRRRRISIRSTLLRSWRTLPGQACDCSIASASSPSRRRGRPVASQICSMKYSTSSGMSSRRSARAGTRTGTTFRRWNRSSRKRPSAISVAQVAGGRGDHAHVDLHVGVAADPPEALLDQHAQDAALGLARHVGDLVEEEGAAVGLFEDADLARGAVAALRRTARRPCAPASCRGADGHEARCARRRLAWIRRATISLPEPGGPEISTRLLVGATLVDHLAQLLDRRRTCRPGPGRDRRVRSAASRAAAAASPAPARPPGPGGRT